MNGLGGLNKSKNGVVIGLVQLQLPVVETPEELTALSEQGLTEGKIIVWNNYCGKKYTNYNSSLRVQGAQLVEAVEFHLRE